MSAPRVSDATSRLERRRREQRTARLIRVAGWSLAGLLAAAAVYLFAFSPVFAAQQVTVAGADVLTKAQVREAAGVTVGTPLARVDIAAAADAVAGLPPVAEVEVARSWPDAVTITITERTPRLALPDGDGYLLADASGVVFDRVDKAPAGLVQVVADSQARGLLVDVGTVFSALSEATAKKVARIEAPTQDSIELRLRDGRRVIWGSAEQSAVKSQVLDHLLGMSGRIFDVSAPSFPTRR